MVSEGAPAAELLGPCGRLEGSSGAAGATRCSRGGRRPFRALPAGARTMPGGPAGGGSSRARQRRLQHRPVLGGRAPDGGAAAPRAARPFDAKGAERTQRPEPHPEPRARWRGPHGGAGAGRAPAPREMPRRARCRLYLRSRLTSAARFPGARAPPGGLARPHPYTSRDTDPRPSPRRPRPREPCRRGAGKRGCAQAFTPPGGRAPPHAGLRAEGEQPGRGRASPGPRQAGAAASAQRWGAGPPRHARTHRHRHTRALAGAPATHPRGAGREKAPDLGRETPAGTLPRAPQPAVSPNRPESGLGHGAVRADVRGRASASRRPHAAHARRGGASVSAAPAAQGPSPSPRPPPVTPPPAAPRGASPGSGAGSAGSLWAAPQRRTAPREPVGVPQGPQGPGQAPFHAWQGEEERGQHRERLHFEWSPSGCPQDSSQGPWPEQA